jgi:serine protease Do
MEKAVLRVVLTYVLWMSHIPVGQALDSNIEKAVRGATFEFWAPGDSPGSKGLAGTAFAIGPNRFVTAAHLLNSAIGGHFGSAVLVDSSQNEYPIADILQFSEQQDFVVFSLERPPRVNPLAISANDQTEPNLYFAGWQHGGKIVIEHGTFAGSTPDEQSGQFDWLRFSGPIWGGVGGGPLLDGSGHVIGIVQARARNGGANYAVPVSQLPDGETERAHIHAMDMLRSLMPAVSSVEPLKAEIPLPMPLDKFAHELQQLRIEYFERVIGPLLDATRRNFVLTGSAASDACNLLNGHECQCKAPAGVSGTLVVNHPETSDLIRRVDNSGDAVGTIAGAVVVRTRNGDDTGRHGRDLTSDARLHLELVIKRQANPDLALPASAKSASWAGTDQDGPYVDFRERTWRLRSWQLLDQDFEVVSLARKLPDGHVILTRIVPASMRYAAELQIKFVANLIYYQCEELTADGEALMANTAAPSLNATRP